MQRNKAIITFNFKFNEKMEKTIFKIKTSRSGLPYHITCDSKLGKAYLRDAGIETGKSDLGEVIMLGIYALRNTAIYGYKKQKASPRDWFLLVFIDGNGNLCTTCFHSASYGSFLRLLDSLDYIEQDINNIKISVSYDKDPIKCDKGEYYRLLFSISDNPITDAEKEAIEQYKQENEFAHLPIVHIVKAFTENPHDVQRIADMLNLSEAEIQYITDYATRIDTATGLVETPAAILQLNAKN